MQTDLRCEKADCQADGKGDGEWTVGGTHRGTMNF